MNRFNIPLRAAVSIVLLWTVGGGQGRAQMLLDDFETALVDPDDGQCSVVLDRGAITVPTVWRDTPRYCDYLIRREPGVNVSVLQIDGVPLVVEPGVVVRLEQGVKISVLAEGSIQAVGSALRRIRFEGVEPSPGFAEGMFFSVNSAPSELAFTDLAFLGRESPVSGDAEGALDGSASSGGLALRRVTVTGSAFDGANFENLPLLAFESNRFFGNDGFAIRVGADQAEQIDVQSRFDQNTSPYVAIEGVSRTVQRQARWSNISVPYFVPDAVNIESGAQLQLSPGSRFVMGSGAVIRVRSGGAFIAAGTATQPIQFSAEQATPGYWDGIFFQSTSELNQLSWTQIRHGGGNFIFEGNVNIGPGDRAAISNSLITDSSNFGVCIGNGADVVLSGNQYANNPDGNIGNGC